MNKFLSQEMTNENDAEIVKREDDCRNDRGGGEKRLFVVR
jgi:hypothetical protein